LRCFFQNSSNLPRIEELVVAAAGASSRTRTFTPGFGANGEKKRPPWAQIQLSAAAYSICLKPQCGHSRLTFAGDGLATGRYPLDSPFISALRTPPCLAPWSAH